MEEILNNWRNEVKMAADSKNRWKDHPLQFNVAETRQTVYERCIEDVERWEKSTRKKPSTLSHSISCRSYLKSYWKQILVGYAAGVTIMHVIDIIEAIVMKLAIIAAR